MYYCTKCNDYKPEAAFSRRKDGKPSSWCKACTAARNRERYHADPEFRNDVIRRVTAWQKENRK